MSNLRKITGKQINRVGFVLGFVILIGLWGCEPPATFKEPQPTDTANLTEFPEELQGKYVSQMDNSVLLIEDKIIRRVYDFYNKQHPSQLDSNLKLVGDSIINLTTNERVAIKHVGDSIITHVHSLDTVFKFDQDHIVRKYKGYYFVNQRLDNEAWEVKKISFNHGKLMVGGISTKEDIEKLKEITSTQKDTTHVPIFSPTKKQFRKFIRRNGFSEVSEVFVKE
jgi:hypothetical protein